MAHFEPDKIAITGEGVFPRVIFDLPPDKEDSRYEELTQQACDNLGREKSNLSDKSVDDVPFRALADVSEQNSGSGSKYTTAVISVVISKLLRGIRKTVNFRKQNIFSRITICTLDQKGLH